MAGDNLTLGQLAADGYHQSSVLADGPAILQVEVTRLFEILMSLPGRVG
jgi:hypothetical protein